MEKLKITEIERMIPLGITNPYLVKCDDGKRYAAKFPGNTDGTRVLINEYVCANLAKLLDLPIPNFALAVTPELDVFKKQLPNISPISGTVFLSEWMDKVAPVPDHQVLSKITNKFDTIKVLIFDVLIGNNDRNGGNLLLNFKNNSFVIIDHSHVFIYEALWNENLNDLIGKKIDIANMNQYSFSRLILCLNNREYISAIEEFISKIKKISYSTIEGILNSLPDDWTLTEKEKMSLTNFLLDRIKRIDEICAILKIERGDSR